MPAWKLWIAGAGALCTLVGLLFGGETSYEWRDDPPPASSLVQLEGSMTRNVVRVGGLSLQARFRDGYRLSWIGDASHVPAGLVETGQGVYLVLVAWGRPRGHDTRPRDTLVCWVRDGQPGTPTVVVPLFTPEPLVSPVMLSWRRFVPIDAEIVRRAPRMAPADLLQRLGTPADRGACPNLFGADNA